MICVFETGEKNQVKMFKILEWSGNIERRQKWEPCCDPVCFHLKTVQKPTLSD